jgi:Kef-type K+ transport system membrane component KefB
VVPVLDPVSRVGLAIALILTVAKLGGDLAVRLKQAAVVGELLAGILLGNLPVPFLVALRTDPSIDMLARLGGLLLLFQVGLDSTLGEVAGVGAASAAVALVGTAGTLVAGWAATTLALPDSRLLLRLFLAAALTATSVGISARVLRDTGAARRREGHTILAASVIDDILGLVVLAILSWALQHRGDGQRVDVLGVLWLVSKTLAFLLGAILVGVKFSPVLFMLTSRLRTEGALVATGLSFCFVLAWASNVFGLGPIVGAFTAGLILEESHSARFVARGEPSLAHRMEPISAWLVPIFFVLMGLRTDLGALASPQRLFLTAALVAAAAAGKLLCATAVGRGSDRLTVAIGLLPRGEVTLVFASLGLSAGLLDGAKYSTLVAVVMLTTAVTPTLLRWRLARIGALAPTAPNEPNASSR